MELFLLALYVAGVALVLLFFRGARGIADDDKDASPSYEALREHALSDDQRQLPLPIRH